MKIKPNRRFFIALIATIFSVNFVKAQIVHIANDTFWNTKDGTPIYSQGGGIFKFDDPATGKPKYYWYGVHYQEADVYHDNPVAKIKGSTFQSVTCYSSTDLAHWTFERDVLTKAEMLKKDARIGWVGRLGVAYVKQLNKYAMFVQHSGQVLILTADSPTGDFAFHQQISMMNMIGTTNTGDQTVFTDEDTGKSYLIYSFGKGRNKGYVSEIGVKDGMVNLLDCTEVYHGEGREGNCMFKYKGKYYLCASDLYGWNSSHAYYLVADNIRGPYNSSTQMLPINGASDDYAHVTQTGFFYTVKGSKQETVIFCGDRWADFAGNGLGYNQWCPLSFTGKAPYFNSLSSWDLNIQTGEWTVGADNNYVKNGSFEADRKRIPSTVKPEQLQLTGWTITVIHGTSISLDPSSPPLNHENTEEDRKTVIGEHSLNITDAVAFERKVSQTISSSPAVKLADGNYTLSAKVKLSPGCGLRMYTNSNGKEQFSGIITNNTDWTTNVLQHIHILNGKVEIGFVVNGAANAFCYLDDVVLVKE